jgi:hypothetical protein
MYFDFIIVVTVVVVVVIVTTELTTVPFLVVYSAVTKARNICSHCARRRDELSVAAASGAAT